MPASTPNRPAGAPAPRRPPKVEHAPGCLPSIRVPVSVYFAGIDRGYVCRVVRVDNKAKRVLLGLPDGLKGPPAQPKTIAVLGWADHAAWHETRTEVAAQQGPRFLWVKVVSGPVHFERRRFVRAKHSKPVSVHDGRHKVTARTLDLSEAAVRLTMAMSEPVYTGDAVHVVFPPHRYRGEMVPIAIDGHVFRIREAGDGGTAGRKEVVIFYDRLRAAEEDFIRGIVFDLHLEERRKSGVKAGPKPVRKSPAGRG